MEGSNEIESESPATPVIKTFISCETEASQPDRRGLTRRQWMKYVAGWLGVGAFASMGGSALARAVSEDSSKTIVASLNSQLSATATAVSIKGEDSSFVEGGGFTKEMFEKVRRNTFIIKLVEKNEQGEEWLSVYGTCWLAAINQSGFYFVTNRHVVSEIEKTSSISMWRPKIDSDKFTPGSVTAAWFDDRDLAVLRCKGNFPGIDSQQMLKWHDDFSLKKGDQILTTGFPTMFHDSQDPMNSIAMGTVSTIYEPTNSRNKHVASAVGVVGIGASGSPVAVLSNGELSTIGSLFAGNELVLDKKMQSVYHLVNLNIAGLIQNLSGF